MSDPTSPNTSLPTLSNEMLDDLRELVDEDTPDFLQELLETFLADAERHMSEMESGLLEAGLQTISAASHTLKSSAANLGGEQLSEWCRAIEARTRAGSAEGLEELVGHAREEFTRLRSEIESLPDYR